MAGVILILAGRNINLSRSTGRLIRSNQFHIISARKLATFKFDVTAGRKRNCAEGKFVRGADGHDRHTERQRNSHNYSHKDYNQFPFHYLSS